MKTIAVSAAVLFLAVLPAGVPAQNGSDSGTSEPQHFYRLNLVVEQLNDAGKVTNARKYEETIGTVLKEAIASDQQIRTGSRVPVATGPGGPNTQFQYIDLGVNFDVRNAREQGAMLSMRLKAEISSIAGQSATPNEAPPVIRQNSWDSTVLIPIGKPTIVFSADDLDDKGRIAVEVTATRVE